MQRRWFALLAVLFAVGTLSVIRMLERAFPTVDAATLAWTTKAPLGTARSQLAAAAVGEKVYAIGGGYSSSTHLGTNEEYNPATNTWTTRATMPTGRTGVALAVTNRGTILAMGGYNLSYLAAVEEYDPATNTWTTRSSLPAGGRWILGAATSGGKVFAIGGANATSTLGRVEAYDLATNSWETQTRASLPTPRSELAVVTGCDAKIYAIGGGTTTSLAVGTVEVYDPAANTWATRASLPTARTGLTAALGWNCKLYAIGGRTSNAAGGELAVVEEYDPASDSWASVASLGTPRNATGAAVPSNGRLYVVGGNRGGTALASVEEAAILSKPAWTPDLLSVSTPTNTPTFTPTPTADASGWRTLLFENFEGEFPAGNGWALYGSPTWNDVTCFSASASAPNSSKA